MRWRTKRHSRQRQLSGRCLGRLSAIHPRSVVLFTDVVLFIDAVLFTEVLCEGDRRLSTQGISGRCCIHDRRRRRSRSERARGRISQGNIDARCRIRGID